MPDTDLNLQHPSRGGQFRKGQSGNPAGKPKGARHKATMLAEKLMQDDARQVVTAVLAAARGGDMTAARMVLDRVAPARRDRAILLDFPTIEDVADLPKATAAILGAISSGLITPGEGAALTASVASHQRALEIAELGRRMAAIEAALPKRGRDD